MKYVLLNPIFLKDEIEINHPKTIKQIESQLLNPKLILGQIIYININRVILKLIYRNKFDDTIEFEIFN
ncbi:MAG: hypothetical protein E6356_13730 [Terrisporobacter othiniensis]|nr:hypothetical protein [Terrisporobacter othiniensis]